MVNFFKIFSSIFSFKKNKAFNFDCKCCKINEKEIILSYIKDCRSEVDIIIGLISLNNIVTGFEIDEKIGRFTLKTSLGIFAFAVDVDDQLKSAAALSAIGRPKIYVTNTGTELTFQITLDRWEYWFTALPSAQFTK